MFVWFSGLTWTNPLLNEYFITKEEKTNNNNTFSLCNIVLIKVLNVRHTHTHPNTNAGWHSHLSAASTWENPYKRLAGQHIQWKGKARVRRWMKYWMNEWIWWSYMSRCLLTSQPASHSVSQSLCYSYDHSLSSQGIWMAVVNRPNLGNLFFLFL